MSNRTGSSDDRSTPPTGGAFRRLRSLEPLVGIGLFVLALAALYRELRGHGLREIGRTLHALPADRVALALGLVIVSYGVLTLYDHLAVRYAGRRLPYATVAPASFVSCALSHNLGMAALTSVPMRYRFYAAAGLDPTEIARSTTSCRCSARSASSA